MSLSMKSKFFSEIPVAVLKFPKSPMSMKLSSELAFMAVRYITVIIIKIPLILKRLFSRFIFK